MLCTHLLPIMCHQHLTERWFLTDALLSSGRYGLIGIGIEYTLTALWGMAVLVFSGEFMNSNPAVTVME